MKNKNEGPHGFMKLLLPALFVMLLPGWSVAAPHELLHTLLGLVTFVFLLLVLGVGLGAFGFLANQVFANRSAMTYRVMCIRPGVSFLVGFIITAVGFGLLIVFGARPNIQLVIFLAYTAGFFLVAVGATSRLGAHFLEPTVMKDELPSCSAHVRSGLILSLCNIVPVIGTLFFLGMLITGVGAALLGFFASMGGAVASLAEK